MNLKGNMTAEEKVKAKWSNATIMRNHDFVPFAYYVLESREIGARALSGPLLSAADAWWRAARRIEAER